MADKILGMAGMAVRAGKASFGVFKTREAIERGKAKVVVAAQDLGKSNRKMIEHSCLEFDVPLVFYSTKELLGKATGKEDLPCMAVHDENMAHAILNSNLHGGAVK
ncbi:MAG: ribosomal L7Ae/L30e/S12e/Gadd45 family protein [Clostridia bacterium]|nr:ribosomal L7Ae/L30e/S12e/Gadd45 family protein [Clostridia bacterium]